MYIKNLLESGDSNAILDLLHDFVSPATEEERYDMAERAVLQNFLECFLEDNAEELAVFAQQYFGGDAV